MRKLTWKQKAKIAWTVLFHRKTPFSAKATMIGGLLYGVLPFDLIPDLLPVLGVADDAMILVVAIIVFLHLTKAIRKEMERQGDVIDVEPL
jgi:uncharacterized membrane protein YkvA (DUF1232 family)